MEFLGMVLIIVINFIVQSTILPSLPILGVVPNTAIIIIVLISLLKGTFVGSTVGLVMGLLQDVFFSTVIGVNGLIYFFIGYGVGINEEKLTKDNILIPIFLSILATIFYHLTYHMFMFFLGYDFNFYIFFRKTVILEMLYNGLLSILFYKLFNKFFTVPSIRFGKK